MTASASAGHPSLLLRLERGMDETSMLEHIEYVHTRLISNNSSSFHHHHPLIIKLQIFSHVSKAPFEFSKNVTDALILALQQHCQVDFDFDFLKDTPELSRLLDAFNHQRNNIHIQSIRMIGILHQPTAIWNFIASSSSSSSSNTIKNIGFLKRIHVTIRANEATIEPLCQALRQNESLEMVSICCYHKHHILEEEGLWKSIKDHPTLTKLHLVAMDHAMFTLVSKLSQRDDDGGNKLILPLPSGLKELQLSSLLGGALSHQQQQANSRTTANDDDEATNIISQIWTKFMLTLTDQTPNLQRLGLYSMQSHLTTNVIDDMLCHIHPNLQCLDLQGNYFIQSIFFPKWYQKLLVRREEEDHYSANDNNTSCIQLRQVNIGPQWLTHGFQQQQQQQQENNENSTMMMDYLTTLFAKHLWLYQLGGDLECLLEKLLVKQAHGDDDVDHNNNNEQQQQHQFRKKRSEHILTLADWNRSGFRHYVRRMMHSSQEEEQQGAIPMIALWPLVLQRISCRSVAERSSSSNRQLLLQQRQASVLNMALQESAAHLLVTNNNMEKSSSST